jgi:hypothetical protein
VRLFSKFVAGKKDIKVKTIHMNVLENEGHDVSDEPISGIEMRKEDSPWDGEDDDTKHFIAKDADSRDTYEFLSMTIPIIKQPQ